MQNSIISSGTCILTVTKEPDWTVDSTLLLFFLPHTPRIERKRQTGEKIEVRQNRFHPVTNGPEKFFRGTISVVCLKIEHPSSMHDRRREELQGKKIVSQSLHFAVSKKRKKGVRGQSAYVRIMTVWSGPRKESSFASKNVKTKDQWWSDGK